MNSRLIIQLDVDLNGVLTVLDHTNYREWGTDVIHHGFIEFITDSNKNIIAKRLYNIRTEEDIRLLRKSPPFKLSTDGVYTYQRLVIPELEHFWTESLDDETSVLDEQPAYDVKNKYFLYNDNIYYSEDHFVEIPYNLTPINSLEELWEDKFNNNEIFWYDRTFITVHNIHQCLRKLQKESFQKAITGGCQTNCIGGNNDVRDFLLHSCLILEYLIQQNAFADAQRIIGDLNRCGGWCDNGLTNKTNCGCGDII